MFYWTGISHSLLSTFSSYRLSHKVNFRFFSYGKLFGLISPYASVRFVASDGTFFQTSRLDGFERTTTFGLTAFRFSWLGCTTSPSIGTMVEMACL